MPASYRQNMPVPEPQISAEDQLWELLERGMYRQQNYTKKSIYASGAHCPRHNTLTLNTEVNDTSLPSLALYAELGNCVEDFVIESLRKTGNLITTQVKPKFHADDPKLSVSGIIDIVYRNPQNQVALLEIKSTSQVESKEVPAHKKDGTLTTTTKPGIQKTGPSLSHRTQAEIYAGLTGITDVAILYISRNVIEKFGTGIAHYIYQVDTSLANLTATYTNLYYAQLCYERGLVPVRPGHYRKTIECKHCDLLDSCWQDEARIETAFHVSAKNEAAELAAQFMHNREQRRQDFIQEAMRIGKIEQILAESEQTLKERLEA